jgi:hypothetical protein
MAKLKKRAEETEIRHGKKKRGKFSAHALLLPQLLFFFSLGADLNLDVFLSLSFFYFFPLLEEKFLFFCSNFFLLLLLAGLYNSKVAAATEIIIFVLLFLSQDVDLSLMNFYFFLSLFFVSLFDLFFLIYWEKNF